MSRRRKILLAAILLAAPVLAEVLVAGVLCLHPRRGVGPTPPALHEAALKAGGHETLDLARPRGGTIKAELYGGLQGREVVVYGHGYRESRRRADPLAEALLREGFSVLAFDFAGSGDSSGWVTGAGAIEADDVPVVIEYLVQKRGVARSKIAYVGFSMGAAAGALSGAALKGTGAVVLIASYAELDQTVEARTRRWASLPSRPLLSPAFLLCEALLGRDVGAVRPVARIGEISPTPLLLIGSAEDWRAPPADLDALFAAAGSPKERLLFPKGDHMWLQVANAEVTGAVASFLEKALRRGNP
ncbi:MAG TPA: alpha/beta hydrolase [Myxococcales bacterium]|jgi:pimeloyl-ACP methyl ester carboxylesterase